MKFSEKVLEEVSAAQDWRALDPVAQTIYCRCGGVWRSHHKATIHKRELAMVVETACPDCGKRGDVRRASGDRESFTI